MKLANRIITCLVIVLLTLIVLLLIGVIFYNSDKKMELGSLSDWISSLSTAGTLLIAYMAYRKAPDWFESKNNEARYDHALKLMTLLDESVGKLNTVYIDVLVITDREKSIKQGYDLGNSALKVKESLNACTRYNIIPTPDLEFLIDDIIDQASDYMMVIATIKNLASEPSIQQSFNSIIERHNSLSGTEIRKLFKFK